MTKVLLVEDDNNLREIYEARLAAEGYEISTAKDGEDALAVAKQVKPDLIISDVMMPRISGFEMLDILRNTDGLKHTKIIMLTALGQAEDKTRADSLGADRYLVKSQVTLEDIVKAAEELLNPDTAPATPEASNTPSQETVSPAPTLSPIASPDVAAVAHQPEATPMTPPTPMVSASEPNDNPEATVTPLPDVAATQPAMVAEPTTPPPAVQPEPVQPAPESANNDEVIKAAIDNLAESGPATPPTSESSVGAETSQPETPPPVTGQEPSVAQIPGKKVITPINDINEQTNELQSLLAQEQMKEDQERGVTGTPVVGDVSTAPETNTTAPAQTTPDTPQTPPPGGVFVPNENGNANENAL